jgi:hypothetical protein
MTRTYFLGALVADYWEVALCGRLHGEVIAIRLLRGGVPRRFPYPLRMRQAFQATSVVHPSKYHTVIGHI